MPISLRNKVIDGVGERVTSQDGGNQALSPYFLSLMPHVLSLSSHSL